MTRDLRLLAGAVFLSAAGDLLALIVLALQVHELTGSGLAVSALFATTLVPMVALAPLAGLVADRFESVRVLVAASLAQALVAAASGVQRRPGADPRALGAADGGQRVRAAGRVRPRPGGRRGIGPGVKLLVYSGAAAAQRGLDVMVDSCPDLDGVHVAFVVAHPPSRYVQGLMAKAAQLGMSDRLHIVPYVPHDQVVALLSSADAGVIPIHHWPNHEIALITKYFEYAHARLPMIVSDVRTMAETTRSTGLGEVFRAEDVEDFVRVVKIVMSETQRYRAAYDRPGLLENWTWGAQAQILDDIYCRLLPDHPTESGGQRAHHGPRRQRDHGRA